MILQSFREHLADELEKFPTEPDRTVGLTVTTAALTRQLLDYLKIDDLAIPNGLKDDPPEYPLRIVLDRILHFRALHQDGLTTNWPGKPDLVTLYSGLTQEYGEHLYIRMSEYINVVGRVASDDRYVARHLFRRTVTLLSRTVNTMIAPSGPKAQLRDAEFRKWVQGMGRNAWSLLVRLVESGELTCPTVAVECYELCYGVGVEEYLRSFSPISTGGDLVGGYGRTWRWAPLTASKVEICGREKFCMHISSIESEVERETCHLIVPYDQFIEMFNDCRGQLDGR